MIDAGVFSRTGGEDQLVGLAADLVFKKQRDPAELNQRRGDLDNIVVARRLGIAAGDFGHRKVEARGFDIRVGYADLAQKLRAAAFEPAQIIGVVDHAHLIGVAVDHPVSRDVGQIARHQIAKVVLFTAFLKAVLPPSP